MTFSSSPLVRRRLVWVLGLVALAAVAFGALRMMGNKDPVHGGRGGPVSVRTAVARKGEMPIILTALGTVTPLANVTVKTQVNGQLMGLGFQEGQTVQAGDFLAQIDPRPFENALAQAEGQLQRDQALLREAELTRDRYKKLLKEDSIARQQLDTQESLVQQYHGAVLTDEAQIRAAKLNLTYSRITAPVTGRMGLRQVDVGNYVQTSDANGIVTITQMQPITVLFTLPEDTLPALNKRLAAGATLEVTALDRAQDKELARGQLAAIDNQIDTATGTIKLRAQFDNADSALFPNQFVNVRLHLDTLADTVVIPTAALQRGASGAFVYGLKPDSTVTVRPVQPGPSEGEITAILDGLAPGDTIVTDGTDKLREGAKVRVPDGGKETAQAP